MNFKLISYLIILLITIGVSCDTENEPITKVTFKIQVTGYDIQENDSPGSEIASEIPFDSYQHKFAPATLIFNYENKSTVRLYTGQNSLTDFVISLPVGYYTIKGSGGISDYFENGEIGYYIDEQEIRISDTTTSIIVNIRPICGMMMIVDDNNQIDECRIVNGNYSFPFIKKDSIYFMYFFPHSETIAKVQKIDGSSEDIYLAVYGIGLIHKILSSDL